MMPCSTARPKYCFTAAGGASRRLLRACANGAGSTRPLNNATMCASCRATGERPSSSSAVLSRAAAAAAIARLFYCSARGHGVSSPGGAGARCCCASLPPCARVSRAPRCSLRRCSRACAVTFRRIRFRRGSGQCATSRCATFILFKYTST
ncbi:hypothetical protein T492DRAFT_414694 [Pavlovales sp. CCMP2436]|nr:hypothetical protein T492DRAFT_414694 [Pavlovales sp. CCMP2436]